MGTKKKQQPAASPSVSGVTPPSPMAETPASSTALAPHLTKRQQIAALQAENAVLRERIAELEKNA